jgi:hypothetical protein
MSAHRVFKAELLIPPLPSSGRNCTGLTAISTPRPTAVMWLTCMKDCGTSVMRLADPYPLMTPCVGATHTPIVRPLSIHPAQSKTAQGINGSPSSQIANNILASPPVCHPFCLQDMVPSCGQRLVIPHIGPASGVHGALRPM